MKLIMTLNKVRGTRKFNMALVNTTFKSLLPVWFPSFCNSDIRWVACCCLNAWPRNAGLADAIFSQKLEIQHIANSCFIFHFVFLAFGFIWECRRYFLFQMFDPENRRIVVGSFLSIKARSRDAPGSDCILPNPW